MNETTARCLVVACLIALMSVGCARFQAQETRNDKKVIENYLNGRSNFRHCGDDDLYCFFTLKYGDQVRWTSDSIENKLAMHVMLCEPSPKKNEDATLQRKYAISWILDFIDADATLSVKTGEDGQPQCVVTIVEPRSAQTRWTYHLEKSGPWRRRFETILDKKTDLADFQADTFTTVYNISRRHGLIFLYDPNSRKSPFTKDLSDIKSSDPLRTSLTKMFRKSGWEWRLQGGVVYVFCSEERDAK